MHIDSLSAIVSTANVHTSYQISPGAKTTAKKAKLCNLQDLLLSHTEFINGLNKSGKEEKVEKLFFSWLKKEKIRQMPTLNLIGSLGY